MRSCACTCACERRAGDDAGRGAADGGGGGLLPDRERDRGRDGDRGRGAQHARALRRHAAQRALGALVQRVRQPAAEPRPPGAHRALSALPHFCSIILYYTILYSTTLYSTLYCPPSPSYLSFYSVLQLLSTPHFSFFFRRRRLLRLLS